MRLLSIMVVAGFFATSLAAQAPVKCNGKLSESSVENLLSSGVSQGRVEQIARTCGIGFEVTSAAAARLRRAGASSALLGVLRELQPKRLEPPPEPRNKQEKPPQRPNESAAPATGATRVNPKDGLTYVWIAPGAFTMGCSPGDSECYEDEKPAHRVTIAKGFWIGRTEVTQAPYERVTGSNPSHFKGESLPVETISWDEAQRYCVAVGMRLPTEAEWEYAARGGNPAARDGDLDAVAWHAGNSGNKTHEVAQKQANRYGLYDTLGNVWEWVEDWNDKEYYVSSPSNDPKGPTSGQSRTLRGASWDVNARFARVSYRRGGAPGHRYVYIGVRCAGD